MQQPVNFTVFVPTNDSWATFLSHLVLPAKVSEVAKQKLLRDVVMGHYVVGSWDAGTLKSADGEVLEGLLDASLDGGV